MTDGTMMSREIRETPQVVARQLQTAGAAYREIGERLKRLDPGFAITCARGSSDHAATYFKYLCEMKLGVPVASIGPSVASVYGVGLKARGAISVAISQSGRSPDLLALQAAVKAGGAHTVALVNMEDAPLAVEADELAPLKAGPELAVAATKSYVTSLVAIATIVAAWADDAELAEALHRLPEVLEKAVTQDWSAALVPLAHVHSIYTIGRGPGLAIADESALKFKETCGLHAESYSAAEVKHGPIALAREAFGALVFVPHDAGRESVLVAAEDMRRIGAQVFVADSATGDPQRLATVAAPHHALDPISQVLSFYRFVEQLSVALGENPDAPDNLKKVTETK